jgi:hypothetical protein
MIDGQAVREQPGRMRVGWIVVVVVVVVVAVMLMMSMMEKDATR